MIPRQYLSMIPRQYLSMIPKEYLGYTKGFYFNNCLRLKDQKVIRNKAQKHCLLSYDIDEFYVEIGSQ